MTEVKNEYVFKRINGSLEAVEISRGGRLTVETLRAKNIGSSSATLEGEISQFEDLNDIEVYFSWLKRGEDPPVYKTPKQLMSSTGKFTADISGLSYKNYTFWAVAETSGKTLKGRLKSFSTTS